MLNSSWFQIALSLGVGAGVGWLYFGALWVTVQRLLKEASAAPAILILLLSTIGRLAMALATFYWLATLGIVPLIVGISGFTIVAIAITALKARQKAQGA